LIRGKDLKIKWIEVQNFGPFYGNHRLDFQPGVNLVFGDNGSGKTFLFKALGFALYGTLYTKIGPEVINRRYLDHNGKFSRVLINFDLLGKSYTIERAITKKGVIKLKVHDNKDLTIEDIYKKLPPYTAPFFLFDGEEVRRWVMSIGKDRWDTASVLGLGIYQGVIDDLKRTMKELKERIFVIEQRSGIIGMRTKIKTINSEISQGLKSISDIQFEIKKVNEIKKELQKIRSYGEKYKVKMEKIKHITEEIKSLDEKLKYNRKRARLGIQMAPYAIIKNHLIKALEFVEHMKELALEARFKQGRLDAQTEILEEIYEGERCICGNPLASSEYGKRSISNLFKELDNDIKRYDTAAKAEFWPNLELMEMRSKVDLAEVLTSELNYHLQNIDDCKNSLTRKITERKGLIRKAKEIEHIVKPTLGILALDKYKWFNAVKLDKVISKYERKIGVYEGRIEAYKDMIHIKRNEKKVVKNTIAQTLATEKNHINRIKEAQHKVQNMLNVVENAVHRAITDVLKELEKKIREIFKMITNKPEEFLSVEFSSSDGTPHIITNDGKELAMSEISDGERQIVMFSLMSALKYMSPAEALIVDAPFGRLDSKHIKSVVSFLPAMSAQTILLITDREYGEINRAGIEQKTWHIIKNKNGNKLKIVV